MALLLSYGLRTSMHLLKDKIEPGRKGGREGGRESHSVKTVSIKISYLSSSSIDSNS